MSLTPLDWQLGSSPSDELTTVTTTSDSVLLTVAPVESVPEATAGVSVSATITTDVAPLPEAPGARLPIGMTTPASLTLMLLTASPPLFVTA